MHFQKESHPKYSVSQSAVASKTVSYCILYKFASICFGKIPGTEQAHWGKTGSMFYGVWVFGNSIHALKIIRQG